MTTYRVPSAAIARAESLMTDTVQWTRNATTATVVVDPVTGLVTAGAAPVVFTGPCRRFTKLLPRHGGGIASAGDYVISEVTFAEVPLSAPALRVNDVGVITASVEHPGQVGFRCRVVGLVENTQSTKQRLQIEAVID